MSAKIISLMLEEDSLPLLPRPYQDQGFDGDDQTGQWLLLQASRMDGAIHQGWKLKLVQGEILTQVCGRVPGFFDRWLQAHWSDMSRGKVASLMSTWQRRDALGPFIQEDDFQRVGNPLPVAAVYNLAQGGAMEEVVEEVLRRLQEGGNVSAKDVADLNREAKAKRSGKPAPWRPQPTETLALNLIRKGEVDRYSQALALAKQAEQVDDAEVMAAFQLRQLPKSKVIQGMSDNYHRLPSGRWVRMPHEPHADVVLEPAVVSAPDMPAQAVTRVVSLQQAAIELGLSVNTVSQRFSPKRMQEKGPWIGNGLRASRFSAGLIRIEQVNE